MKEEGMIKKRSVYFILLNNQSRIKTAFRVTHALAMNR